MNRSHSLTNSIYSTYDRTVLVGDNFEVDMAKMAADPTTQKWWAIMMPMQQPIPTRTEGEWWADMKEVFHVD
jgi:L-rhamnose mutarotase